MFRLPLTLFPRAKLQSEGIKTAHVLQLDVTNQSSVDAAAKRVGEEQTHLDVLINNAGISGHLNFGEHATETSVDTVKTVYDTNVFGVCCVHVHVVGVRLFISIILGDAHHCRICAPLEEEYQSSNFQHFFWSWFQYITGDSLSTLMFLSPTPPSPPPLFLLCINIFTI